MNVIASHMSSMQDPAAKFTHIPNRKQGNLACPPAQGSRGIGHLPPFKANPPLVHPQGGSSGNVMLPIDGANVRAMKPRAVAGES